MEVTAATKTFFPPTTPWLSGNKNNLETTTQLPIRLLGPSCLGLDHALLLFFPQLLLATIPVGFPSFQAWFFQGWRVMFKCCFMKSGFGACWVVWMDYNRHSSFTPKRGYTDVYWHCNGYGVVVKSNAAITGDLGPREHLESKINIESSESEIPQGW